MSVSKSLFVVYDRCAPIKYIGYIVLFVWIVGGCQSNTKTDVLGNDESGLYGLKLVDTIEINIDSKTNFITKYLQLVETDSTEFLIYQNSNKPSIQIYDLDERQIKEEIVFNRKGPIGIGQLNGFYFHNPDSIFILNGSAYKVFLVNEAAEIVHTYDMRELLPNTLPDPRAYTFKPILYNSDNQKLYIPSTPGTNPENSGYWNSYISTEIDLVKNTAKYVFNAPKEYHNLVYGAYFNHYSVMQNEASDFVYAFTFDSELFVTDYMGKYEKHYAGSKYFDKIPQMGKGKNHEQFYIESNSYGDMLYDKWRKVYYRVAYRAIDMIDQNGRRHSWNDKIPSIIILNDTFEKIGEVDVPKETYQIANNMFIGKKGLYISNNHIKNPMANEDKLSFSLFVLEQL